jgi:hypothetical protein
MRYRSFDLIISFRLNLAPVLFRRYLSVFLSFHLVISISLGISTAEMNIGHRNLGALGDIELHELEFVG